MLQSAPTASCRSNPRPARPPRAPCIPGVSIVPVSGLYRIGLSLNVALIRRSGAVDGLLAGTRS